MDERVGREGIPAGKYDNLIAAILFVFGTWAGIGHLLLGLVLALCFYVCLVLLLV
jgi:hypothetical protein